VVPVFLAIFLSVCFPFFTSLPPIPLHPRGLPQHRLIYYSIITMKIAVATILAGVVLASAEVATTSLPPLKEIHAAAATTLPESPTSDVKGLAFDRFYQIWIENIVSDLSTRQMF
jgi:hypothetical protein